jgi:hypothetical protein
MVNIEENLLVVHNGVKNLVDGVQDVHAEGALVVGFLLLGPLLGLGIEEVLTPEPLHQFADVDLEFFRVHFSELLKSEGPTVQTRTETDRTFAGVDLQTRCSCNSQEQIKSS